MVLKGKIRKLEDRKNHTGVSLINAKLLTKYVPKTSNYRLAESSDLKFNFSDCDPGVIPAISSFMSDMTCI